MTTLPAYVLPPDELDSPQRALYESLLAGPRGTAASPFEIVDGGGALRGPFAAMLLAPHTGGAVERFGASLRFEGSVDDRLREIAILVVAREMQSVFERTAHEIVARATGLSDTELDAIRRGRDDALAPRDASCVSLVREIVTGVGARASDYADMFKPAQIYELSVIAGYYRMLATHLHLFGLDEPATPKNSRRDDVVDGRSEGPK